MVKKKIVRNEEYTYEPSTLKSVENPNIVLLPKTLLSQVFEPKGGTYEPNPDRGLDVILEEQAKPITEEPEESGDYQLFGIVYKDKTYYLAKTIKQYISTAVIDQNKDLAIRGFDENKRPITLVFGTEMRQNISDLQRRMVVAESGIAQAKSDIIDLRNTKSEVRMNEIPVEEAELVASTMQVSKPDGTFKSYKFIGGGGDVPNIYVLDKVSSVAFESGDITYAAVSAHAINLRDPEHSQHTEISLMFKPGQGISFNRYGEDPYITIDGVSESGVTKPWVQEEIDRRVESKLEDYPTKETVNSQIANVQGQLVQEMEARESGDAELHEAINVTDAKIDTKFSELDDKKLDKVVKIGETVPSFPYTITLRQEGTGEITVKSQGYNFNTKEYSAEVTLGTIPVVTNSLSGLMTPDMLNRYESGYIKAFEEPTLRERAISVEKTERDAADSNLGARITQEANARESDDIALANGVQTQVDRLDTEDVRLQANINEQIAAERLLRESGDSRIEDKFTEYAKTVEITEWLRGKADEFGIDTDTLKWDTTGTVRKLMAIIPKFMRFKGGKDYATELSTITGANEGDVWYVWKDDRPPYTRETAPVVNALVVYTINESGTGSWVYAGNTEVDLSEYLKKADAESTYVTKALFELTIAGLRAAMESGDRGLSNRISSVETSVATELANVKSSIIAVESGLDFERQTRESSDNTLLGKITDVSNALATESGDRKAEDKKLEAAINVEKQARIDSDSALSAAMSTFDANLQKEKQNRESGDKAVEQLVSVEKARAQGEEKRIEGNFDNYYKKYLGEGGAVDPEKGTYSAKEIKIFLDGKMEYFIADPEGTVTLTSESGYDYKVLRSNIPFVMRLLDEVETVADLPSILDTSVRVGDTYIVKQEKALYTMLGQKDSEGKIKKKGWAKTGSTDIDLSNYITWNQGDAAFARKIELFRKQDKLYNQINVRSIGSSIADQHSILGSGMIVITVDGGEIGNNSIFTYVLTAGPASWINDFTNYTYEGQFDYKDIEKPGFEYTAYLSCDDGHSLKPVITGSTITGIEGLTAKLYGEDGTEQTKTLINVASIERVLENSYTVSIRIDDLKADPLSSKGTLELIAAKDIETKEKNLYIYSDENYEGHMKIVVRKNGTVWDQYPTLAEVQAMDLHLAYAYEDSELTYHDITFKTDVGPEGSQRVVSEDITLYPHKRIYFKNTGSKFATLPSDPLKQTLEYLIFPTFDTGGYSVEVGGKLNSLLSDGAGSTYKYCFFRCFMNYDSYGTANYFLAANNLILPRALADNSCEELFRGNATLRYPPTLQHIMSFGAGALSKAFMGCHSLQKIPNLNEALTESGVGVAAFDSMFADTDLWMFEDGGSGEGIYAYKIPDLTTDRLTNMFLNIAERATPNGGQTYYTHTPITNWNIDE